MNRARVPQTPTLPQGEPVASYGTYLEAQRAVDHLADKQFPVQLVTIVGTELRMVERVTGRLSYPRVAAAGLASGAWFGLFVGLLMLLFTGEGEASFPLFAAILIGAAFGMLFSVVSYAFTRGKRDFTSSSQIVATSYAVLCQFEKANQARNLLGEIGGVTGSFGDVARPSIPEPAPVPSSDWAAPSDQRASSPDQPVPSPSQPAPTVPDQQASSSSRAAPTQQDPAASPDRPAPLAEPPADRPAPPANWPAPSTDDDVPRSPNIR